VSVGLSTKANAYQLLLASYYVTLADLIYLPCEYALIEADKPSSESARWRRNISFYESG
jgi:hypothetical protein